MAGDSKFSVTISDVIFGVYFVQQQNCVCVSVSLSVRRKHRLECSRRCRRCSNMHTACSLADTTIKIEKLDDDKKTLWKEFKTQLVDAWWC